MVGSHAAAAGKGCTAGKETGIIEFAKLLGREFRVIMPAASTNAGDAMG